MFSLSLLLLLLVLLLLCGHSHSQYDFCLTPTGCKFDECCFNIVSRFQRACHRIPSCRKPFSGDCCQNSRVVRLDHGYVYGYAQLLDDTYGFRDSGNRYLQMFLGVRYARPPSRELNLRFKKPQSVERSQQKIDAMSYGASCPQHKKYLDGLVDATMSEDCLNLNIFVMNDTRSSTSKNMEYAIMVFFHGGQHKGGSANLHPGHMLAQTNIMVITVNYRLGPLGFLSTEDDEARGNYGLWDQLAALQWIKDYGRRFKGDIKRVTVVGYESGAADMALQMLQMGEPLFHQMILMSGSDLMEGGFVKVKGEARQYAYDLGTKTGCYNADTRALMYCLAQREYSELVGAAENVRIQDRKWYSRPWSPNIDGELITDFPAMLRLKDQSQRMRVIGGITEGDGSYIVEEKYANVSSGRISAEEFRQQIYNMTEDDLALDKDATTLDINFQYLQSATFMNSSIRLRKFVDLWTDRKIATGLDQWLKIQSDRKPLRNHTQMYVFKYKSKNDPKCKYLGAYHGSELQYLFGLTYLNDSDWSTVGLKNPPFYYGKLDMNMTDYMLYMWSNFVIAGNATPDAIRNLTWDTYRPNNRTYFLLDLHDKFQYGFELLQDYRIDFYGYWLFYYDFVLRRMPRFTTFYPTPAYLNTLKVSSITLTAILVLLLIILIILIIVLVRKRKQFR